MERTTETGNRSGTHSSAGSTLCPGSCLRCQGKGPAGARCGGSTLGAAPTCCDTPRAVHTLTFTGPGPPHESLEPPLWWYSKDKVLSNHCCPMPVLTATAATETAAV